MLDIFSKNANFLFTKREQCGWPLKFLLYGAVVKLVITPACHAGGRGFKSLPLRHMTLVKPYKEIYKALFF